MKTLIVKKGIPVLVFLLGILGAFGSMSMTEAPEALMSGWAHDGINNCQIEVSCSETLTGEFCRVTYPNGQIARGKTGPTSCPVPLYRPFN